MPRHVVALGGGGFSDGSDPALDDFVLSLAETETPRVCFVGTASGDAGPYVDRFFDAFAGRAERSVLRLFDREVADLDALLAGQDVVYVGGGTRSTCWPSGAPTASTSRCAGRTRPVS